jgi:hypothetical protein
MSEPIKVIVSDPDSGDVLAEQVIDNDYVVICAGRTHVAHTNAHANGTHVITIKEARPARV